MQAPQAPQGPPTTWEQWKHDIMCLDVTPAAKQTLIELGEGLRDANVPMPTFEYDESEKLQDVIVDWEREPVETLGRVSISVFPDGSMTTIETLNPLSATVSQVVDAVVHAQNTPMSQMERQQRAMRQLHTLTRG